MPGSQPYIDRVAAAGQTGLGAAGKLYRRSMQAGAEGRLEDMPLLQPELSAIKAEGASEMNTADTDIDRVTAFEDQPFLKAALKTQARGRIGQNQGLNWAKAAGGAMSETTAGTQNAFQFQQQMGLQSADDAAKLYLGSLYDRSRKGGLLSDLWQGAGKALGTAAMA